MTWAEEQENAFRSIKEKFRNATGLYLIRENGTFGIETATSGVGIGARLYQYEPGNPEGYTVAYASRSLKDREERYKTTELEGLAVVLALKKWYV